MLRLVRTLQRRRDHTRRRIRLEDPLACNLGRDGTDHGRGGLSDLFGAFESLLDEESWVGNLTLVLGAGETAVQGVGAADVAGAAREYGSAWEERGERRRSGRT